MKRLALVLALVALAACKKGEKPAAAGAVDTSSAMVADTSHMMTADTSHK